MGNEELLKKALRELVVAVELLANETTGVVGLQREHVDVRFCPWKQLLNPLFHKLGAAMLEAATVLEELDGAPLPTLDRSSNGGTIIHNEKLCLVMIGEKNEK